MSDERINARIVDGAHQKMERISKKGLRKGRQFPGAHVSSKEEDSFTARLRRREILESIQQHEALDIVFGMARKARKLRAHPAKLPHHAAYDRAPPPVVPFRKRQTQILHRGTVQIGPHPK